MDSRAPAPAAQRKPVTLQDEAYQRPLYDRTRALKRLRRGIESLFASAREAAPNERTAYIEVGGERYVYVVFANGAVKPEGIAPRPVTSLAQSVTSTIRAVAEHYPDHATQQMIWRCEPSYEVGDGVEFELDREGKPIRETLKIRPTPWFLRARLLAMPLVLQ